MQIGGCSYAAFAQGESGEQLLKGAEARIEKLRKADVTVSLLDSKGKPVSGVSVKVEQVRHSFLFGCAAISLLKHSDSKKEQDYQKLFGDLFNFATVLTYWQDTDPTPDRQNFTLIDSQVEALKAKGITVKGHPLILAGASPRWAPADPDETRTLTEKRIRQLASRFKGKIDAWDVVGDVTTAGGAKTGLGAWARKSGPSQFTADALTWARAANSTALLMYNDYKLDGDYTKLIQDLNGMNAPLDAIGLEAHMGDSNWSLEKLWQTCETFSSLKKPIHFSEITVLSDDPREDHAKAWPSTPGGEQRQADYAEKMYTLLFSHPAVHAIAWWNLVDEDWDRIPGGLVRKDLTPKPAYDRLMKLIKGKWWTTTEAKTDKKGSIKFRGFAGHYRISVLTRSGKVEEFADISTDKSNAIVLKLPAK